MTSAPILITGATGFIGAAIGRVLQRQDVAIIGVARHMPGEVPEFPMRMVDYTSDSVATLVSELQPTVVIHAAGPASVSISMSEPSVDFSGSVLLFQNVLEGVRRSGTRPRVAYLSSAAVYGEPETLPTPETAALRPISPYGHHKAICESLAAEYTTCFGVPSLVLRVFSVFGAAQRRMLVWDLFRKFRDDPQVVLDGTGDEARDYVHIEDLVEQLVVALRAVAKPQAVLNLGSGRSVTLRELAQQMARQLGSDKTIRFSGHRRAGDPPAWRADVSAYEELSGAPVSLDFERRLGEVVRQWRG